MPTQFRRHAPMLLCADVAAARAFYERHLGLTVSVDIGWFVSLVRAGEQAGAAAFELSLCDATHESIPPSVRRPSGGVALAFEVSDADVERAAFVERGATVLTEPTTEPWGQRHFFVQAPDGVVLDLFQFVPPDPGWMRAHGFT